MLNFDRKIIGNGEYNSYIRFFDDILDGNDDVSIWEKANVFGETFAFPTMLDVTERFLVSPDYNDFEDFLEKVYDENSTCNKPLKGRADIITHFKEYFVMNNDNLNDFEDLSKESESYKNIAYCIYKGLCNLSQNYRESSNKLIVNGIIKSSLVYKVSIQRPKGITFNDISSNINKIESELMRKEGFRDYEVHVNMEQLENDTIVLSLLRFDSGQSVSIGDTLEFGTGEMYNKLYDTNFKIPIITGLIDNEQPHMVDLYGAGNVVMVGVSGSAQLAHSIATNIVLTTHYDDAQFVILNQTDNSTWRMFQRMPHVLGYHTNVMEFGQVIEDVYFEVKRRLKLAKKHGCRKFSTLQPFIEGSNASLFLVLDEADKFLAYYRNFLQDDEESYRKVMNYLAVIGKAAKLTGVAIISVSLRGDENTVPVAVRDNAVIRVGMATGSESDYLSLFGKDVKDTGKSVGADSNIVALKGKGTEYIRTPVPGGITIEQTLALIRTIALDWVRNSQTDKDLTKVPQGLMLGRAYNRGIIYLDSVEKIKNNKILPKF